MQEPSEQAGLDAAHAFIEAFNAQNHQILAHTLNYPHIRLANGKFYRVETAKEFAAHSDTFWVATLQDGHWGIQFRSSFLR